MSPPTERRTSPVPVTTMLAATASATIGSSRSQPVSATAATPIRTPGRGPDVGEQVLAVGLDRDGAVAPPGAHEQQAHRQVDGGRDDRDGQPDADVREGLRIEQPLDGGRGDRQGGDEDQRALDAGREVLGLRVPVRVLLVGGLGGPLHRAEGDDRGDEVDHRLRRIGEQADRVREQPGDRLEHDRRQRGRDRQPEQPHQAAMGDGGLGPGAHRALRYGGGAHAGTAAPRGHIEPSSPGGRSLRCGG
jgi:hypothetical protein